MDITKVNNKWYERRWHWTGVKSVPGGECLGYSLRPLTPFEVKLHVG